MCAVILSPNADLMGRINGYKDARGYRAALSSSVTPATGILPVQATSAVPPRR